MRLSDNLRLDRNYGAPPGAPAETSILVRRGVLDVISMMVESGAISQTVQGNVVTFRANAEGLVWGWPATIPVRIPMPATHR